VTSHSPQAEAYVPEHGRWFTQVSRERAAFDAGMAVKREADREAVKATILAARWPNGDHDGFPTFRVADMLADALLAPGGPFQDKATVQAEAARNGSASPVEVTEAMVEAVARIIANAACDWIDQCDDDDHPLGHSNWGAYMDDARAALRAALGVVEPKPAPETPDLGTTEPKAKD